MAKVIMTAKQYVERLEKIAARNTYYSNKYPNNLCYIHADGRTSADCWNLIKALLNGYDVNKTTVGYYQKDLSNTGDVDGATLLSKCSDVSANFGKLKDDEPRMLYMKGHAGSFIGYRQKDGHEYNVIECTGSWERKVLYSWVDADGTRRHYKGGSKNGKWEKHGKLTPWVDYADAPNVTPAQPVEKNLDAVAMDVYKGKYGNEPERSKKLKAEGYTTDEIKQIQDKVNALVNGKPTQSYQTYTVKPGDTLWGIAVKFLGDGQRYPEIRELNGIGKNNVIRSGQVLKIPPK